MQSPALARRAAISTTDTSHGRRVRRTIKAVQVPDWIDFPDTAQIIQLRRTRTIKGRRTIEVVYVICSLDMIAAPPATVATWIQGHCAVENALHWVRDVVFVAGQLGIDAAGLGFYEWSGSTIEYHRAQVREHLGYRAATVTDQERLTVWLSEAVAHAERRPDRVREELLAEFRSLRIELPTPGRLVRMVRSALRTAEQTWRHGSPAD